MSAGSLAKWYLVEWGCWVGMARRVRQHQPLLHTLDSAGRLAEQEFHLWGIFSLAIFFSLTVSPSLWLDQHKEGGRAEFILESRHLCWEPGIL